MTLPIERARTRRPITWVTLLGVLLLPVVIGGILVAALYNPIERLDNVSAAIVNDDEPVTIDGKTVPLGRQLTAGLVKGSDTVPSNLDWVVSNADDAEQGLADGRYTAVVTIPKGFSAAATSTVDGATAEQATIGVRTAPDARVVDDAITATITQTAASVFGQALSKTYLENVFVGFTTLGSKLGEAADGADKLPGGASQLADGATRLADGATSLSGGLTKLATGTGDAAAGTGKLASGLRALSKQLTSTAGGTVGGTASTAASFAKATNASAGTLVSDLQTLLAQNHCTAPTTSEEVAVCTALGRLGGDVTDVATNAGYANGYAGGVVQALGKTADAVDGIAEDVDGLRSGLTRISGGIAQSSTGARTLSTGATQLSTGADQLSTGARSLADGLHEAARSVPAYDDTGATNLATVLADPVAAKGLGTNLFGASAIPLLAMLALWFGGIGSFIALRAVSRRTLTSRRPSAMLALQSLWPAAAVGALQGLLVAGVVQLAASYDGGVWTGFAALCVLAGIAFAAVNQALVAVLGGAGRWIAALVGVLGLATGIVSTAPGVLASLASVLPTAPAYQAMLGALTAAGGVGAGVAGLVVWSVIAFAATTLAVARRRTTTAKALLAEPAAA